MAVVASGDLEHGSSGLPLAAGAAAAAAAGGAGGGSGGPAYARGAPGPGGLRGGVGVWEGFRLILLSPYLQLVCGYMLLTYVVGECRSALGGAFGV